MFTVQQQNAAIAAAQYQQQVAEGFEDIFSAYPTLLRCDANRKIISNISEISWSAISLPIWRPSAT